MSIASMKLKDDAGAIVGTRVEMRGASARAAHGRDCRDAPSSGEYRVVPTRITLRSKRASAHAKRATGLAKPSLTTPGGPVRATPRKTTKGSATMTIQTGLSKSQQLEAMLSEIFGPHVSSAACDPRRADDTLLAQEFHAVAGALPARRREFAAGRQMARRAMVRTGIQPWPVAQGRDGAPVWPRGMVGSIAHTAEITASVVAASRRFHALGVDIETTEPLDEDLVDEICTPSEIAWLDSLAPRLRNVAASCVFSAKKAVCKAQYPVSGQMLDLADLTTTFADDLRNFHATLLRPVWGFAPEARIAGRIAVGGRMIVTGVALEKHAFETVGGELRG